MVLPGGIVVEAGALQREFRFRPLDGALELALRESGRGVDSLAAQVTRVLERALETLGGDAPSLARVRDLSVGDRDYLITRLAQLFDDRPVWLAANCGDCGEPFDLSFRYADLPVKDAGPGYPCSPVETSRGRLRVRIVTGADQEAMALAGDDQQVLRLMLQRILVPDGERTAFDVADLSDADIALLEQRVEAMSPECSRRLLTECPQCGATNTVAVNPYGFLETPVTGLFAEVHRIASHYHWSERDILALTRERRRTYLKLIDADRGLQVSEPLAGLH